ncbi:putative Flp pilus-assembly TadE/G-like protein [Keratinibaculum paraultunense]|uniref:Putative Flp pilus-assembly TadE/G-like protein n=1 Tax=Keratinibaculum paraultunense TaxID=1278232 RepID=A0A4R3L1H9_9FIRM|nr:pilus assembly protein TadG-related protein [Keratinibaculum paraultunense]QQY80126.1 hypothetical protein JL105_01950 [Keratinibaculum paraultunense]TCS91553.1 putative Flp pilus-assembly TadE/G-like protein [Keratinibaculum paraultunense]
MFKKFKKNEKGNITILFALTIMLLMVLLGLSIDVALAFNKRDKLIEVGNLIRDARFDLSEELWHAYYPESVLREIARDIAVKNNLSPNQVDVKWKETTYSTSQRVAQIDIIMTDVYECTILKLFGVNELPIKVIIPGSQDKKANVVWRPGMW